VALEHLFHQAEEGRLTPSGSIADVDKAEALKVAGLGSAVWGDELEALVAEGIMGES